MKNSIALIILFTLSLNAWSQQADSLDQKVYNVRAVVDIPITVGAFALNYGGLRILQQKTPLDSMTIVNLDPNDVNSFDRRATQQDAAYAETAVKICIVKYKADLLIQLLIKAQIMPAHLLPDNIQRNLRRVIR